MSRCMSFWQSLSKRENVCTHLGYLLRKTSLTHASINRRLLLSKLNEDEYCECSVMNKQSLRSVYGHKCVANAVLLK